MNGQAGDTPTDHIPIAVRAYVPLKAAEKPRRSRRNPEPSEWALVLDTETSVTPMQHLRFGTFQWRRSGVLERHGLFYDNAALSKRDQQVLAGYATKHGLELLSVRDFVENIFFKMAYEFRASFIFFNAPFDLSRLAIGHNSARRRPMRGGFSFQLSEHPWRPHIQIKHLTRRASIIRFTAPRQQKTPRGMRKRSKVPIRRGFFVDVKTIGVALTSRSDTLASLAEFLAVPTRKMATEEHGKALTEDYIAYAVNDTQTTWECYCELSRRYTQHQLTRTPLYRITSEAGIGKAYLSEMGIEPWRLVQPDFSPEITNVIMQSYFGGRSEVHLRRVITQVAYLDYLSTYPTCCALMGLWQWIIAKGVTYRDSTDDTRALLAGITDADLQRPLRWRDLATLVQIDPADDLLPVRAPYDGGSQYTIGLNFLTSEQPRWYTLADCINSKGATGRSPSVLKALTFTPRDFQLRLKPIDIAGNPEFRVDPRRDDFFKRVIELRASIRARMKICSPGEWESLDSQQLALKILANATSYGIFMEMNVEELAKREAGLRYRDDGQSTEISLDQMEVLGRYFHPLLGTLITGAARLMLGLAERQALARGLDWAFTDTDSMAFAKPIRMSDGEFYRHVFAIQDWFDVLNPFADAGRLFKLEDTNFLLRDGQPTGELWPLYLFAVSSKRYAMFNSGTDGRPVLRKASAHGLGHLMPPYAEDHAPASIPAPIIPLEKIGIDRWQHDVWYRIVEAALHGHPDQCNLVDLPGFDRPAASRYGATTPALLRWYDAWNEGKAYKDQVRPFNFLTAFQATQALPDEPDDQPATLTKRRGKRSDLPRPVAPFDANPGRAAQQCFDRVMGTPIPAGQLKTYAQVFAQYHLHPEAKFRNGDYLDHGLTERRHVVATGVRYIGKEANRWEEQFYLGYDPETQIEYGTDEESIAAIRARICEAARAHGQRRLAETASVPRERLRLFIAGRAKLRAKTVARLLGATRFLDEGNRARS